MTEDRKVLASILAWLQEPSVASCSRISLLSSEGGPFQRAKVSSALRGSDADALLSCSRDMPNIGHFLCLMRH